MDSGNSGSMQSSSGGEEEYESRSESISGFLNHHPAPHFGGSGGGSIPNAQPPPPTFFDSFSHPPTNPNQNPLYNLDLPWSRNPNYSDFSTQSLLSAQSVSQCQLQSSTPMPPEMFDQGSQRVPPPEPTKVKNPKKRTRASRRAPTTVLTTDTTNFRQMVQEFTGIPAAPFSAASPYSRRLDLFGTAGSTMGPLYPLRPSFQKVQLSPYVSSSSANSSNMSTSLSFLNSNSTSIFAPSTATTTANNNNTVASTSTISTSIFGGSNNYQQQPPSDPIGLSSKQSENMLSMQNNPLLTFQSFLQTPLPTQLKHPLGNDAPIFGTKPPLDELGMGQWRGTLDSNTAHLGSFEGNNSNTAHLGSFEGNNNANRENSSVGGSRSGYKLNSSRIEAGSDFHPHKSNLEDGSSSRGGGDGGTLDSWICPSN